MSKILSTMSALIAAMAILHCCVATKISAAGSCASSHEQFATITTYTSALDYLQCQRNAGQLADIFDSASLGTKHKELLEKQCEPHVFIMVGRHAARSPDEGEIEQFNGDLTELIDLIRNNTRSHDNLLSQYPFLDPEYQFEPFDVASNNLLTGVGLREQQELAARSKRLYPKLFDARETQIHLGTTSKLRTAQTATEFARSFDNFDLGRECKPASADPTMACYKHVLGAHAKIELEYHKVCKKQIKLEAARRKELAKAGKSAPAPVSSEPLSPEVTRIFEKIAKLKRDMLDGLSVKVSNKLNIRENLITRRQIESAYNACRYELAASYTSVWCNLFDSIDLEALDYLEDANAYHKISARLESNKLQACPIAKEVVAQLAAGTEQTRREAHFGFTHVGVLKKILAVFGMFEVDQNGGYTEADLEALGQTYHSISPLAHLSRQWRTSLMVPFSANVNFVLYKCPAGGSRVLTTISEQPVRVRGCSDSACPIGEFLAAHGHMQSCDPGRVCEEVAKGLGEGQQDE